MRRVAVLILTAISLSACGPDDHAATESSAVNASIVSVQAAAATPPIAIEPLVNMSASDQPASTPGAAAEQSLAADTQQITPVLHYPPDSTN